MRRSSLVVAAIVLMSTLFVGLTLLPDARASTLYVGGAGPGNYTTIQTAVNDANPGDSIFVYSGVYNENVQIAKPLTLAGENRTTTLVDGRATGTAITVLSANVSIANFTFTHSYTNDASLLLVTVSGCRIEGNNISSPDGNGIRLYDSTNNTIINNTVFSASMEGIILEHSDGNYLTGNTIISSYLSGIRLYQSDNNRLSRNSISYGYTGVNHRNSVGTQFDDNVMIDSGILIWGDMLEEWNSHEIDTSNTVNGRPIIYLKDVTGGVVPPGAGQVILANCKDMIVENQNVSKVEMAIAVGFSRNITVVNNTVNSNGEGTGIFLHRTDGSLVLNNEASWNYLGVYVRDSAAITVASNTASFNRGDGIAIYTSSAIIAINNTLLWNEEGGLTSYESTGSSLANNTMVGNGITVSGINVMHWITHDIETSNTVNGKPVHYWNGVIGGTIPPGAGQVILADSRDVVIEDQNVSMSSRGIQVGFSSNITVANVTSSQNVEVGMLLYSTQSSSVSDCNTSDNSYYGIYLYYSDGNLVVNNSLARNNQTGLRLMSFSEDNIVSNNVFLRNGDWGAVYVSSFTYNNRFYHNNFIESRRNHVFSRSDANDWDDGYPSGGNYWSDYAGTDQKSGPNQDQPGNDGIGDDPYVINSDNQDNYPLLYPFEMSPSLEPSNLTSELSGTGFQNVTLKWDVSKDDGAGRADVVGYSIFRGAVHDVFGLGYSLHANVTNGTSVYVDSSGGEGNPDSYFYRVCAVNLQGIPSCAAGQAGKITRSLRVRTSSPSRLFSQTIASSTFCERWSTTRLGTTTPPLRNGNGT